jgi:hypothetical protein
MEAGGPYVHSDQKIWTVYPIIIRVSSRSEIRLNEEHTEFSWIEPGQAREYLLPQVSAAFLPFRVS